MENKKLGLILVVISILVGIIIFSFINELQSTSRELNCFPTGECLEVESSLSISHISVGILAFIFALGFYLLFFNSSEQAILNRLEQEKDSSIKNEKFNILLKALDENEKKVLKAIRLQQGITQSTLTMRTSLSRSKVSEIIKSFEAKNLIKRKEKGKTYSIFLIEEF